jgi:hypothetical protein
LRLRVEEETQMAIQLNHIIIPAKEKWSSARFLAEILGTEAGAAWGPFVPVRTSNGVTIDFVDAGSFEPHHCAFLIGDADFDAALERLRERGIAYYADFSRRRRGVINHVYGGRGVYLTIPTAICLN